MINQVNNTNPQGKAIVSLILGVISLFPAIIWNLFDYFFYFPMTFSFIAFLCNFIFPLLGMPGLIIGIMGLKSTKRNLAIIGIILNLIGLLVPLYYFLFY